MNEAAIGIAMGDGTEKLLKELLNVVDVDNVNIDRELESSEGLAGEPITVGAVVTGSTIVLSTILRLIERYLEHMQQRATLKIVAEGFEKDSQLGAALTQVAKKYADVSISYGIAREAWGPKRN